MYRVEVLQDTVLVIICSVAIAVNKLLPYVYYLLGQRIPWFLINYTYLGC